MSVLGACREADERPGMTLDCNEPDCIGARGNAAPLPVPSRAGDGSGGNAGSGNMPGAAPGTLAGTVQELLTADLVSARSLEGSVDVRAPDDEASDDGVSTRTGQGGMFRLDGIQQSATVWVEVGAFADPPAEPFMDTLQAVDSLRDSVVDLLVVRRDLMRDVALESFLFDQVELDPAGAHIVIRFVRQDRTTPLDGVHIAFPPPSDVSTAYDAGDIYSDALDATSTRGMAVLFNLSAAKYPGSPINIVAEIDGEQFGTELRIAAGAVTLVTAVIADP
jgi:hypothetical protein